jgi:NAD(P)-dependent dehydrogenase (short-subunit alcohol dehydrogenase family)
VTKQLAKQRYRVIITARDEERAKHLAKKLAQEGLDIVPCALDITDRDSIKSCVAFVNHEFGALDVLVNNAAGGFDIEQSVLGADLDAVEQAFQVNLFGAWRLCDAFMPLLKKSNHGRIVNVSSEAASFGSPDGLRNPFIQGMLPAYSLSKNALNAYTVKLAQALRDTFILVNAVCPGHTATHPETDDEDGARAPEESARGVVWAATLPDNGPTGQFFRDGKPLVF